MNQANQAPDKIDQALITMLQGNLPLEENPYEAMGKTLGIPEDEVVKRLRNLRDSNKLKRIGAVLRHQRSGYIRNAMVVFQAEDAMAGIIGKELAASPLVSHCYERVSCDRWPYNLYAMVHSRNENEIEAFIGSIVEKYELGAYKILYSVKELKKTSMIYHE
ncbi:MAG TPA: Lrp/AsnC family transcriptional regulator [Bacillota bacterium]|nr:Lrp/AsnC family transcriptional regulator [Bacillota bacterium]